MNNVLAVRLGGAFTDSQSGLESVLVVVQDTISASPFGYEKMAHL